MLLTSGSSVHASIEKEEDEIDKSVVSSIEEFEEVFEEFEDEIF